MKLEIAKNGEEVNLGTEGVIQASIDVSSLPFLYKLATKNQYSDPIGSIVRELVSNAYDATTEANSDKPVVVEITSGHDGGKIRFIDKGVGMSPERIQLYMQWYNSSKREDNVQIGGFGIGGKSPLAYTSYYFIDTVHDGILYKYIISEGETIPECLLLSSEATDLPNGTTVHFEIETSLDLIKFKRAIPRQLCYFDNVWINDLSIYNRVDYDNEGTIYDTDLFKYSFNNKSDELQKLHVLIDKVPYPINFSIIKENPINIPFGLKFDIGELEVTPSRENLMYTDTVIEKIKTKIRVLRKFVYERYSKQDTGIQDLFIYIKYRNSKIGTMTLGEKMFDITTLIPENRLLSYTYPDYPDYVHISDFTDLFEVKKLVKGKLSSDPTYFSGDRAKSYIFYLNGELNNYSNIFIREGWLCRKSPHYDVKDFLRRNVTRNLLRRGSEEEYLERLSRSQKVKVGWSMRLWKSAKVFREYLIRNMRKYPHPTEYWIEDYKAEMRAKRKSTTIPKGKVLGYTSPGNRYTFELEDLAKKSIIFYVIDSPSSGYIYMKLLNAYDSDINAKGKFKEQFMFLSVSETQYKNLKVLKNLVHINDFYKVKALKKMFGRLYYLSKVREKLIKPPYRMTMVKRVSEYYNSLHSRLSSDLHKYRSAIDEFNQYHYKYVKPSKRWSACYSYMLLEVKEFNKFYRTNDFINYVDNTLPDKYLVKLVKGKHLNKYQNVEERRIEEDNGLQESSGNETEGNSCEETRSVESVEDTNSIPETSGAELNCLN